LAEEDVDAFFKSARKTVLQEKKLLEVTLLMGIIYASQTNVNLNIAKDGFDLILVQPPL
jgi:hypothetical protein